MVFDISIYDRFSYSLSKMRSHRNSMPRVTERTINPVHLAYMRHHIEGKIQCASPNVFDLCVFQLWVNLDHLTLQNFRAAANSVWILWEERRPPAKDHTVIP